MSELPQRVSSARPTQQLPAHLQCGSCSKALYNGFQTPHGCRLCQPCVTRLLSPVQMRRCPGNTEDCRDTGEEVKVSRANCLPDMATRREVARLTVQCPNCDAGCTAAVSWALADQHLDSCDFQVLPCELCSQQVTRKDLQRHSDSECQMRKETCGLCCKTMTVSEMNSVHKNLDSDECCPRFSGPCPHCVGPSTAPMSRQLYLAHLPQCPEKPVVCKYSHLGCSARVRKSELEKHYREFTDSHLELVDSNIRQAEAIARQTSAAAPVQQSATPLVRAEVADVNRRVGSVVQKFKGLQVNVANWAQSTMDFEKLVEDFGGIDQLRTVLILLDERARCAEQLQQQVQLLKQQVQLLQQGQLLQN